MSPIGIYNKFNQYIGNADYPLLRCTFCEISYSNNERLKLIGRQLGQYHTEIFMIQDLVGNDKGSKVAKDLVKGKMYSTKTIPIPGYLKREYETLEREKRERLRKEEEAKEENELNSHKASKADFTRNGNSNYIKVMKIICHCKSCEILFGTNTIINKTAEVETLSGKIVQIDVQFCYRCCEYYIDYNSLQNYESKFGRLLLERYYDVDIDTRYYKTYKPDTILSRCGYRAQENDRRTDRQRVIEYILESRKAEKFELKEILSGFITMRSNRCYMAVDKWKEDLEFINSYNNDNQELVNGLTLIRNPK